MSLAKADDVGDEQAIFSPLRRGPQLYFAVHDDVSGMPLSSISRSPVSKMNEKSLAYARAKPPWPPQNQAAGHH